MNRLEILRKYQDLSEVKMYCRALNCQSEIIQERAMMELGKLSRQAMDEAGVERNEQGQFHFVDAVYFDLSMHDTEKIELLAMCKGQEIAITELS